MLASSRLRGHRVRVVPVIVAIAFLTCVTKLILVQDSFSYVHDGYGRTGNIRGEHPLNVQDIVRMESDLSLPLNISGKHGQMVISVNADDLDDIVDRTLPKHSPQVPNILLHNPEICHSTPSLRFLIYVHSSPVHRIKRDLLRRTYANPRLFRDDRRFAVVFFLGLSQEKGVQELVRSEFQEHGDIVQGYFVDHYRNMTLKVSVINVFRVLINYNRDNPKLLILKRFLFNSLYQSIDASLYYYCMFIIVLYYCMCIIVLYYFLLYVLNMHYCSRFWIIGQLYKFLDSYSYLDLQH